MRRLRPCSCSTICSSSCNSRLRSLTSPSLLFPIKAAPSAAASSDVVGDVMKVGALLASWRRTKTVIFHIRDEAQSLAKDEGNELVSCHREFVPPPPTLAYLRQYFGNLFGLNCLVTATMFPTLLEESLWGFFGSTGQNVRSGLPISASVREIRATLGSNYLPKIVPALRPYVSPGYIGVDHVVEWRYTSEMPEIPLRGPKGVLLDKSGKPKLEAREKKQGEVAHLQYGANHSGVRYDGSTRTVETASELAEAKAQAEVSKEAELVGSDVTSPSDWLQKAKEAAAATAAEMAAATGDWLAEAKKAADATAWGWRWSG